MKKLLSLLLCFGLFAFCFAGCSLVKKDADAFNNDVVVKVGTEEIKRSEVQSLFNTYYYNYYYKYYYSEQETMDIVLSSLVNQKLILIEAKKIVTLNNADKKEIWDSVREAIDNQLNEKEKLVREELGVEIPERLEEKSEDETEKEYYPTYEKKTLSPINFTDDTTTVVVEGFETPDDEYRLIAFNQYVAELVQVAKLAGKNTDKNVVFKSKLDEIYKSYEDSKYVSKYQEYIESRMPISDNEILAKFNELVSYAAQTSSIVEFSTAIADTDSVDPLLFYNYVNEDDENNGYIRVQHILIKFSDEQIEELEKNSKYNISSRQEYNYYNGEFIPETDAEKNSEMSYDQASYDELVALKESFKNTLETTKRNLETGDNILDGEDVEIKISISDVITELDTIFNDDTLSIEQKSQEFHQLMYTYSADSANFSTGYVSDYMGYALPIEEPTVNQYVFEFEDAARELAKEYADFIADPESNTDPRNKYVTIVSSYGVHFMQLLEVTQPGAICESEINAMKNRLISNAGTQSVYDYCYDVVLEEKKLTYFSEYIANLKYENKDSIKWNMTSYKKIMK